MAGTWQRLDHVELSSSGTEIASNTFTAKDNLKIVLYHINTGGYVNPKIQFNGDSGSNYASRYSDNGGSDTTSTGQSEVDLRAGELSSPAETIIYVTNKADKEKLFTSHTNIQNTAGAGNAPARAEVVGKWQNTSAQITSLKFIKSASGSFASGSYVTVFGATGDTVTDEKETLADATVTTSPTVTVDDDFSSDNFTNVGSQSGWGVSSNSMAWTTARGSTVQGEYRALPSTFSGNFVVRFKLTPTTVAYTNGTEEYLWVGLTNSASCNSATSQNQAGVYFHNYSTSDSKYQVTYKTNGGLFGGAVATSINFSSTAYWVEIIKDGDSVKLTLYSDEYSTPVSGGTATSTAGGATDSYTHFVLTGMYHGSSTGSGSSLGTIDDLKIYKDMTEVSDTTTSLAPAAGTRYEETDTRKIYRMVAQSSDYTTEQNLFNLTYATEKQASITSGNDPTGKCVVTHSGSNPESKAYATLTNSINSKNFTIDFTIKRNSGDSGNNWAMVFGSDVWDDNSASGDNKRLMMRYVNGNRIDFMLDAGGSTYTEDNTLTLQGTNTTKYYRITGNGTTAKCEYWASSARSGTADESTGDLNFPTSWLTEDAMNKITFGGWGGGGNSIDVEFSDVEITVGTIAQWKERGTA